MTTTQASLARVDDIIDEYLQLGLDGIFLRPLSPFGFAIKTKQFQRYDPDNWLAFYEQGLRRILEINHRGRQFREFYASLILTRMFSDKPIGYVDLRSPSGVGIGALVYNYDGNVFASDEGRMGSPVAFGGLIAMTSEEGETFMLLILLISRLSHPQSGREQGQH